MDEKRKVREGETRPTFVEECRATTVLSPPELEAGFRPRNSRLRLLNSVFSPEPHLVRSPSLHICPPAAFRRLATFKTLTCCGLFNGD